MVLFGKIIPAAERERDLHAGRPIHVRTKEEVINEVLINIHLGLSGAKR
jgi:hypothetical protein